MKWLQWSKSNLEKGLGGVEVHAQCVARELRSFGIQAEFSSNPAELLNHEWDVIHTHGSGYMPSVSTATSVHTLHGTTLGRMAACGEWFWLGGYRAWSSEVMGTLRSDVTLSVHPELSLFRLARNLPKVAKVCWNGWDAGLDSDSGELPEEMKSQIPSDNDFWIFVGRGEDKMKGADYVLKVLDRKPAIKLFAAPGAGFLDREEVISTGRLTSSQVKKLMSLARGLIIPSRYEGNSLVVLEALAEGLPVLATPVGGVPVLPADVSGLVICQSDPKSLMNGMMEAGKLGTSEREKLARKELNRAILPTWRSVAEVAVESVELAKRTKTSRKNPI